MPSFDASGTMVSVRAKWVHLKKPVDHRGKPTGKSPAPSWGEGSLSGRVLANLAGVEMLRGEQTGAKTVVVAEGESDFLTRAKLRPDVVVLGYISGGWSQELADRVPDGSTVVVRTDHDGPGHAHATKVGACFGELRRASIAFKNRYNAERLVQKHNQRSPAEVRANLKAEAAIAA